MKVVQDELQEAEVVETIMEQPVEEAKPQYEANKKYSWEVDTKFVIDGQEFGLILNSLRTIVNNEEAARIILAHKASLAMEDIMARAVENGDVVEVL